MRFRVVHVGRWSNRPGKLVASWRDLSGKRRAQEFPDSKEGLFDATQFRAKTERDLNAGVSTDHTMTFGELAEKFMKSLSVRPPTIKQYSSNLKMHLLPGWKDRTLPSIRKPQVTDKKLEIQAKLGKGSLRNCLTLLRSIFKFGTENEYIIHDPTAGATKGIGTPEKSRRPLREEEVGRLLRAAQEVAPDHVLHFITLLETGVRLGELLALREDSIEGRTVVVRDQVYEDGTLVPPKSARGRRPIRVSGEFLALVRETFLAREKAGVISPWLLQPEFSLPHPTRRQSLKARRELHQAFKDVAKQAHLPSGLSPHWLRHTHATDRLSHGEPLANVSVDLGHSRLSTTLNNYIEAIQLPDSTAADEAAARRKKAMETADMTKVSKFSVRRVAVAP